MKAFRIGVTGGVLLTALFLAAVGAAAKPPYDPPANAAAPSRVPLAPAYDMPAFDIQDGDDTEAQPLVLPTLMGPTGAPFGMTPPAPDAAPQAAPQAAPEVGAPGYVAPFQMVPGQPVAAAPAKIEPAGPKTPDRFIVPVPRLRLEGESVSRGWVTWFTQQEVERPATLLIGYLNAIYVMPERSRMRVTINGQLVAEIAIASPQGATQVTAAIPAGVLRAGGNLIRIDMLAVHRTDCSIESTYDLWVELDNALTGVAFAGGPVPPPVMVEDLPAVGVDVGGSTHIRFIHNGPIEPHHSAHFLAAAQALTQRGRYSHPIVSIVGPEAGPAGPGTLNVIVGLAEDLRAVMANPPALVGGQPLVRFFNESRAGGTVLVLAGETTRSIDAAIDRLAASSGQSEPNKLAISSRFAPDAPYFTGAGSVRFSELGVMTQEFSGRRLQLRFPIGLPADFYGSANGQARILLDAAYAPSVRPGSVLSVYVNGSLASSYMLTDRHGGLMERKVIKVPLTHFRAGLNRVWIEVMLDVDSDQICGPGATLAHDKRFVVFDSSEFVMDNFARIGTSPNLAAFFGGGFPYFNSAQPVAVVMRQDKPTVAAAATVLARLSFAQDRIAPVDTAPTPASLASRPVLFIGEINQIAPEVLRQVGVVEASKIRWRTDRQGEKGVPSPAPVFWGAGDTAPPEPMAMLEQGVRVRSGSGNDAIFDRWRDQVAAGSNISAELLHFQKWVTGTFGFSLGLPDGGDVDPFNPPHNTSVLVAQGFAPNSDAVWTLIAGHTAESLDAAINEFTLPEYWAKTYGQAVAFDAANGRMDIRMPSSVRFIVTQPLGPSNLRLIAANWLSLNIVTYALVLVLCCIAFAFVTSLLLRRSGRRA